MAIRFKCGSCGKGYRVADRKAGRRGKCVECSSVLHVPDQAKPDSSAGDAEHTRGNSNKPSRPQCGNKPLKKPAALDREAAQTMLNGLTLLYASVCLWAVGGISLALSLVVSTNDLGVTASDSFFGPFLLTGAFVLFMLAQCVDLSGRMACWVAAGRGDVNGRGLLMASICLNIVSVCIALWPNSVRGVPFAAYLDGLVPVTAALLFVGFVGYLAARIRDSAAQELTINCLGFLGTGAIAYVVLPVMVRRPGMGTAFLAVCLMISTVLCYVRLLQTIMQSVKPFCLRQGRPPGASRM